MSAAALQLPSAVDSERLVLGSLLLAPERFAEVRSAVATGDFYHPTNAAIFEAMEACDESGDPIEASSVAAALAAVGKLKRLEAHGGLAYLAALTGEVATTENVRWHARRVAIKARRRRWLEAADAIKLAALGPAEDDDFFAEAERISSGAALHGAGEADYRDIRDVLTDTVKAVEERYDRKQIVSGVPSGYEQLDELTGGFQPGQLIVIGGRAKMAKTSLAMGCVERAATGANVLGVKAPCLIIELEMADTELGSRLASSRGGIDGTRLRNGFLDQGDWIRFAKACGELGEAPIKIYDRPATFSRIRTLARKWRSDPRIFPPGSGPGLLVVDYLGLIQSDAKGKQVNREQEVAAWSRGFKALAKEIACPVILLAQLNRGPDNRPDKRPTMADLRESGAIEQDADLVALVYRDEYYNADTPNPGIAEVIIAAARHCQPGTIPLRFEGPFTRFSDLPPGFQLASSRPERPARGRGRGGYTREPAEGADA